MIRLSSYHLRPTFAKLQETEPALRNARKIQKAETSYLLPKQRIEIAHGFVFECTPTYRAFSFVCLFH